MRKLYNVVVLVIDLALLVVIINAATAKGEAQTSRPAESETYAVMPESQEVSVPDHGNTTDLYAEESQETEISDTEEITSSDSWEAMIEQATSESDQNENTQGLEQFLLDEPETDLAIASDVSQSGVPSDIPPGGYEEYIGMEDFNWYTSIVSESWFPEEAIQFNEFQRMKGKWRAYIKFDPMNEAGRREDMLLHIYISGDEDNVEAEYDWYWYQHLNEPEGNYDDSENSYYYGAYKDGEIYAEGAGDVAFRYFYEWDGEEYAIGVMHSQAGVPAILCMMR